MVELVLFALGRIMVEISRIYVDLGILDLDPFIGTVLYYYYL